VFARGVAERFLAKKKPSGRSPDGLFPQLPAHSRFHRCDFGEADRMLSFQPLIVKLPPSARLSPSYALKFYRQRSDKINVNQSLTN
jgi:hypothetical protein